MQRIPVIIDTDPGIDDFFALLLANSAQELDVRAVTAVAGNESLEITATNALAIASKLKMQCPVAKGADRPLNIEPITAAYIHGENGLGNVDFGKPKMDFAKDYAWDVIYDEAVKQNGQLEIIALGPLTNVAIALLKYPDLVKLIKRIVLMGGSSETGNRTPYGEFNIVVDPLSADIVFKSGIPLVMVGLNTTMKTVFSREDLGFIYETKSEIGQKSAQMLDFLFDAYYKFAQLDSVAIHDALAVAYVINPQVAECKDYFVGIETHSSLNMGRTVVDIDGVLVGHEKNCSVSLGADKAVMMSLLKKMMEYYS